MRSPGSGTVASCSHDLERRLGSETVQPTLLMLFDLDGFKGYNDTFGHPAGDALLARLGAEARSRSRTSGAAYRLGGDEFCMLTTVAEGEAEPLIDRACAALTEHGEGFEIETSFGAIMLPDEATDATHALQAADERLYAQKYSRRGESERTMAALLEALSIREPELQVQLAGVGALAGDVGRMLGLRRDEIEELDRAAQLHDLGKLAVPDEILHKPGAARRARVGLRPPAHDRRRADPAGIAGAAQRRHHRPRIARELGRQRISRRDRR